MQIRLIFFTNHVLFSFCILPYNEHKTEAFHRKNRESADEIGDARHMAREMGMNQCFLSFAGLRGTVWQSIT